MKEEIKLKANTPFDNEASIGFLESEYAQCFEQMRHYDTVETSFIGFALTGYVAVVSGLSALSKYLEAEAYRDIVIGGLLLLAFFIGIVVLTLMVRNRVYFVVMARQVNSLRNYFLNNIEKDFIKYNKCYTDPHYPPAFNLSSTYTLLFFFIAILNAGLGGAGSYLIIKYFTAAGGGLGWIISLVIAILILIAQVVLVAYYLRKSDSLQLIRTA